MTSAYRQILEEAAGWFVDVRLNDLDAATRAAFDEWLRRSPEHIRAYLEMAETYTALPPSNLLDAEQVNALIERAREQSNILSLDRTVASPVAPNATPLRRRPWLLAASVAIVCLTVGFASWFLTHRDPTFSTAIGEQRSITLADGSTLQLNARSRVRVRFTEAERTIDLLDGQALFDVAKDASRPFVVRSEGAWIRAVGTQFDVRRKVGSTTVTVVKGRVEVLQRKSPSLIPLLAEEPAGAAPPILLSAGEQITVTRQAEEAPQPTPANVAAATAWMQRRLLFDETPLVEVADEFNRYAARPLVIHDAEIAKLHISGVYASTDPASLLRFLEHQPGIAIRETEKEILIIRE